MTNDFRSDFLEQAAYRMDENSRMIRACFDELSDDEIWKRPNASSNSVGNLILHLCGNITQYAISSLGGSPDTRDRDREFAAREGYSKTALLDKLIDTVERAKATMQAQDAESLLRVRSVQGFRFSGIGIILHVVEHYSYHTGQIAFWTKILRDKDLGFYAGFDLNIPNMP